MASTELPGDAAPILTSREVLLEVYKDMKFVRPAVEGLLAANVVARVEQLERDKIASEARGVERRRIGDLSGRTIGMIVVVSNFVLGLIVMFSNLITTHVQ